MKALSALLRFEGTYNTKRFLISHVANLEYVFFCLKVAAIKHDIDVFEMEEMNENSQHRDIVVQMEAKVRVYNVFFTYVIT